MDPRLLDILVCPICKGALDYRKDAQELVCKADRLAFSDPRRIAWSPTRGAQARIRRRRQLSSTSWPWTR